MLGKKLSPILSEIEYALWEHEANERGKPGFTEDGFRASIKIFMSALMERMWELQVDDNIEMIDRENMAQKAGDDLRKLVKTYTGIDTIELYKKK